MIQIQMLLATSLLIQIESGIHHTTEYGLINSTKQETYQCSKT